MDTLTASGLPLFFPVANPVEAGLPLPAPGGLSVIRTAGRSLLLMQKEALVHSAATGRAWRLSSDEGAYLMGDDAAPCPLAHLTVGMVASFMEEIGRLADERGIGLKRIRLVQDNYYTMEGSALKGTMRGGALPVRLKAEIESAATDEQLAVLIEDAVRRSPVHALMGSILPSKFTLNHNGRVVEPRRVTPMGRPGVVAPDFERALPQSGDWAPLVRRDGLSPKTGDTAPATGSSFAEKQSRRLHVRGICTIRDDGIKLVEQQLLNPHGSVFHFLSEERPRSGEPGRAPDALSYVSAGIAFCFMTQFGRYAKIAGKPIRECSIVQDTCFSPAHRSSPPAAGPVETHVSLESDHDDDFAKQALDMSEQTCFLHALCRSSVGVDTALVRPG